MEQLPEKFTKYQIMIIGVLAALQFIIVLDFMIISPIGYLLTKDLNITTKQFGLVVSSYVFSAATAGVIAAGFIDRYGRKKLLLFLLSGFTIGTLFCALSSSFVTLLAARIITGIFGGVSGSLTIIIVADVFTAKKRGRALGIIQMAFAASQILGIPIGLFIANNLGWQFTFLFIVAIMILIQVIIILKLKPIDQGDEIELATQPFFHLWRTIINKHHQYGFYATIILGMGMMLQPFISIFLINNIQLKEHHIPVIFMITGVTVFFVMPLIGRLSDKFDRFKLFLFGSAVTIIIIPIYTHLPVVPFWVVVIMNIVLFASITSRMVPFQAMNSMIPQADIRGSYLTMTSSLQQFSGGIGIVIASSITFQRTPESPLENFGWLGLIVVALSVFSTYLVHKVYLVTKNNFENRQS
ncbi:MAG TPA: MFS transporter [Chryseobacterium sp.]|nr:MFS transporter [Chryseobacterium sp.]